MLSLELSAGVSAERFERKIRVTAPVAESIVTTPGAARSIDGYSDIASA
ncbi:MAG TPA: hypothetical protein VFY16_12360 [Gemmatimonadaceae bacterium]|nr:hypothetical protein [Gemmatimonadaceae bacterium]